MTSVLEEPSPSAAGLLGRHSVLDQLAEHVRAGHVVLLYGPRGVGKTAVLRALVRRSATLERPLGESQRTEALADLVDALAAAYPEVEPSVSARRTRTRLRLAAEARPCVLLLDHVGSVGTAFKSLLRSLRGAGCSAVIAGDADSPGEHERLRGLHLTHRELELPRLGSASMRALISRLLERAEPRHPLHADDHSRLVRAAEGLPGRAVWFANALAGEAPWREGRVRAEWLQTEALARSARELVDRSRERLAP